MVSPSVSESTCTSFQVEDIRRPDRDNTIDVYISDECEDVLADGVWQQFFTEKPEPAQPRGEKGMA